MSAASQMPSPAFTRMTGHFRCIAGLRLGLGIGLAVVLAGMCAAQVTPSMPEGYHPEKATSVTAVNQRPDANRLMQMRRVHLDAQRFAAANLERMRQLSADAARLVQLTAELKADVERESGPDARLAARLDLIEKLAHAVKEKMKLTTGAP